MAVRVRREPWQADCEAPDLHPPRALSRNPSKRLTRAAYLQIPTRHVRDVLPGSPPILLAVPLLRERLGVNKIAGRLLAFTGIARHDRFQTHPGSRGPWWAVALPFLVGGAVLTVAGLVAEGGAEMHWSGQSVAALAYSSPVGTALAWALWFALVGSGEE